MVQQRYVLVAVIFLILGVIYGLRSSFPLILTQMVYIPNSDLIYDTNDSNKDLTCPVQYSMMQNDTSNTILEISERYEWSQEMQGIISSSYFWGFILTQIPGGILSQKHGGRGILLITFSLSVIVLALTPIAVFYGDAVGLIVNRIILGLLQGLSFPCITVVAAPWFPLNERGRMASIAFMGISVGSFIAIYLVGTVMNQYGRWDVIFYGLSVITAIITILIGITSYDNPQNHPFISEKEKEYLRVSSAKYLETERQNLPPTPWKGILTSSTVIMILVSSFFGTFSTYIIGSGGSKYLNDVLHIPIEKNSIYSSIPRVIGMFISIISGFANDWMHVKLKISLTNIRKTFVVLSSAVPGIFPIVASFSACDETLVVTMISLTIIFNTFTGVGTTLSPFDLGPNYIGPINAIFFLVYSFAALVAPYIMGIVISYSYLYEWRTMFWINFIASIISAVVFIIWGSAEVQPWNSGESSKTT